MVRNLVSPDELDEIRPWVRARIERHAARGGYGLIGTPELAELLADRPDTLLVDARDPEAYEEEHIRGARNFTLARTWWGRLCHRPAFHRLLGPDPARPIVFYCTRPTCSYADAAPRCAVRQGYLQVYRYFPGLVAWKRRGLPLEGLEQRCLLPKDGEEHGEAGEGRTSS